MLAGNVNRTILKSHLAMPSKALVSKDLAMVLPSGSLLSLGYRRPYVCEDGWVWLVPDWEAILTSGGHQPGTPNILQCVGTG